MNHLIIKAPKLAYLAFAGLVLAGAILLVIHCLQIWTFTIDDAFITFRYSENLVSGIGPTFNATGPRAEGYTSFLWMLVMTLPHFLHYGVESFAKLMGILATFGTMAWIAIFLWHVDSAARRGFRMAAAGLAIFLFGLLPETAVHAVSGMETAGYAFFLAGLVTLTYLATKGNNRALNWLPIVGLLAGLMRPEANLVVLIMLLAAWRSTSQKKGFLLRAGLLYILPGIVYFFWRWNYYGVFLPLPFYIKTGTPGLPGVGIVVPFLAFLLGSLGVLLGAGLLGERKAVIILLLAIVPNLFFFLFSSPIMDFDYRFLFPALPLAIMLAGMGLAFLMERVKAWSTAWRWEWLAPGCVALFSILMFLGQNVPRTAAVFSLKQDYAQGLANVHHVIGKILYQVPHSNTSPVLAVTDAGAIPYFSEWMTVDCWGLNDPAIAFERVQAVDYIFAQNPEVLVLSSTNISEFHHDTLREQLLYQGALDRGMEVVVRAPTYEGNSIWVLARPGSQAAQILATQFGTQ